MNGGWGISYEIALRWMPLDLTDDKSTLVQVMAWCRQATGHYLNQCWPRSQMPYGVTRPQWVKPYYVMITIEKQQVSIQKPYSIDLHNLCLYSMSMYQITDHMGVVPRYLTPHHLFCHCVNANMRRFYKIAPRKFIIDILSSYMATPDAHMSS